MKDILSRNLRKYIFAFSSLICYAFFFSFFIGFDKTGEYWLPFLMMLCFSVVMMFLAEAYLNSDAWVILLTTAIMTTGIFAQALTLPIEAPVRKSLSLLYETAMSAELIEKYPNKSDQQEIKSSINACLSKGVMPDNAREAFKKAADVTRIDVLDYMENLEKYKDKLASQSDTAKKEKISATPTYDVFYEPLYNRVLNTIPEHKNENLYGHIKLFRTDNYYKYENPLTFSQAETLDKFFKENEDVLPSYQKIVKMVEHEQRQEDAASIIKYIFFGYFSAMLVIALCNLLCFNFDVMTIIIFVAQMALMLFMVITGKKSDDDAIISAGNVNLLEVVKITYILIMANLVGKSDKENIILWPVRWIPFRKKISKKFKNFSPEKLVSRNRLWIALWYNIITAMFFLVCSEMGTMLILIFTGSAITFICTDRKERKKAFFPKTKKWVTTVSICIIVLAVAVFSIPVGMYFYYTNESNFVTDKMLEDIVKIQQGETPEDSPNVQGNKDEEYFCIFDKPNPNNFKEYGIFRPFMKIDQRVYGWLNASPYNDNTILNNGSGIQYVQLISARHSAGWLGCPPDDEESVEISVSESDMIFGQIVHSMGVLIGLVVIALYVTLIAISYGALQKADDFYYRTLGLICVVLLAIQNLMHIAVNISCFPISGVSLMYISRGGTIQAVSLIITMMILKVSSNNFEISSENENTVNEIMLAKDDLKTWHSRLKSIVTLCCLKPGVECFLEFVAAAILLIITFIWW